MKYSLIDCHADTASVALDKNVGFYDNGLQVDLAKVDFQYTQFFAAFIAPEYRESAYERTINIIKKLKKEISNNEKIAFCKSYDDYLKNNKMIRAFLSVEGLEAVNDVSVLDELYGEGVRMATLTWNYSNQLAGGVLEETKGLTLLGRKVVRKMNELGMILDVSHLNDRSFWDVIEENAKTVIASHSNSRKICDNKRNLTDEQFLAIRNKGGVVGINLYPLFLSGSNKAKISDIIKHVEHFLSLGGEENIGMGCDFDGVDFLPEGITGMGDIYKLFDEMIRLGYNDNIINKLSCTNMERILQENLCKNSNFISKG